MAEDRQTDTGPTVGVPFFSLLQATEGRIQQSIEQLRLSITGLATKEDIKRVENHLLRHDTEIAELRDAGTAEDGIRDHKRHTWRVVAAIAGGLIGAVGATSSLIFALSNIH